MKLFAELIKIETALVEKHSVAEALAWCGEHRGTLKKTKVGSDKRGQAQSAHGRTTSSSSCECKSLLNYAASAIFQRQSSMRGRT